MYIGLPDAAVPLADTVVVVDALGATDAVGVDAEVVITTGGAAVLAASDDEPSA